MTRNELVKTRCWSCWWREGGHCFSKDFGSVPEDEKTGLRVGHLITPEFIEQCSAGYRSKRGVLGAFFPSDIELVILSEREE